MFFALVVKFLEERLDCVRADQRVLIDSFYETAALCVLLFGDDVPKEETMVFIRTDAL